MDDNVVSCLDDNVVSRLDVLVLSLALPLLPHQWLADPQTRHSAVLSVTLRQGSADGSTAHDGCEAVVTHGKVRLEVDCHVGVGRLHWCRQHTATAASQQWRCCGSPIVHMEEVIASLSAKCSELQPHLACRSRGHTPNTAGTVAVPATQPDECWDRQTYCTATAPVELQPAVSHSVHATWCMGRVCERLMCVHPSCTRICTAVGA